MSIFKCPGSEQIRTPQAEDINCPHCGESVEIWSDEAEAACPSCGTTVFREVPSACWEWCGSARECVGPERFDRLTRARGVIRQDGKRERRRDNKPVFSKNQEAGK